MRKLADLFDEIVNDGSIDIDDPVSENNITNEKYQYPIKINSHGEILDDEEAPTNIGGYFPGVNLNSSHKTGHPGLDFRAPANSPIYAIGPGIVSDVSENKKGGKTVKTLSENKILECYFAHLSKQNVKVGQEVNSNSIIGYVGTSGSAGELKTAPHLHFTVKINGSYVNPTSVIGKPVGFLTKNASYIKTALAILE